MVRPHDLFINVPTHFLCPISLDLMQSPVTLTTGITYDRSSIQHWLDSGHNTCPATMQVLHNYDLVPNSSLKRLIQIWSDSLLDLSQSDHILTLVDDLHTNRNGSVSLSVSASLSKLLCFGARLEQNVKFLGRIHGFVPVLLDVLRCRDVDCSELVVRVLDLVRCEIVDREEFMNMMLKSDRDCLRSLVLVLQRGSSESRIGTARLLECVAINAESKNLIAENEGILHELIGVIGIDEDPKVIESVLSCLIAISMPKRVKIKLVRLGVIKALTRLLKHRNVSVEITEKVLRLLAAAAAVEEGRSEMLENGGECVGRMVRKVMKVSSAATEHAVTALWCICYLFREEKAAEAVAEAKGVENILLLMQSHCPATVRQMAKDLLEILKVNSISYCLSIYDTANFYIMPI
ncbi:U-box domain-containing protein 27-like [Benincasa hispida]|uniref:U-box domain-containing protein 27-like n=1 Tax=Benincasa hispida TaxID=102211 RepID=UPI0019009ED8|nr:U-box domain-containing protein 27-like [Benincasa hispida]